MRAISAVAVLLLQDPAPATPPELWLYQQTNLQVDANVGKLDALWRRAAAAGYTKVLLADSKMAKLGDLGDNTKTYFKNVERVKALARELKLDIVPALFHIGYSNTMLWHDPNLAEGLPVKDALFVVKDGEARVEPDPPVKLGPKFGFVDEVYAVESGVVTTKGHDANARFSFPLKVSPYRCYHASVKIRTEGYTGKPEIKALAGGRSLQWEDLDVKATQDWTEHHVVFNSLEHDQVAVYFGVWGKGQGTLQWKEWKVEEAPLVNVLRRPGTPFSVRTEDGKALEEGKDFEPVADPRLGAKPWKGEYESWHAPVPLKTQLADGTRLRVSWYHPAVIYRGQVSACISEPKTTDLLRDEYRRVKDAFGGKAYMMSHDEFRTHNQDEACRRRNLDAGALLAENARECVKILEGATVYVWNDMFDPYHNAVDKNYYLVRGSYAGSWEGLPKEAVIMNWNSGRADKSLPFFADRGHRQVLAGYYDHDPRAIKKWLAEAAKVKGVVGVMYTTWQQKYDDLEAFAKFVR